jgi:3',5'-cyclic AMP phosphodiesterase CpdA
VTAPVLWATSDLHVRYSANRDAVERLEGDYARDWLIVAGDCGDGPEHLDFVLRTLAPRFARLIWTPGNHDLWCPRDATDRTRGEARYQELVALCRSFNVLTPEHPYVEWPHAPGTFIVPMFLLYDYSFRPAAVALDDALDWAAATGVMCRDEALLDPAPWPSRSAWCHARCDATAARLDALPSDARTILVNHWPLRYDLARPPRIPRFSLWCGTTRTEDWALRYRASAVVSGHLHFRTTLTRHGVRYEEVSLGYPRDWRQERGLAHYLRAILPEAPSRTAPRRDPFVPSMIRSA